ncbi:MAG TPA: SusD/RagB family nutrient-binding outer membrane lipoprotein [Puia sp.]|nr:SusD/RagB family nutrient-binding outer membrane lipoprotein [Puia sp.]
MRTVSKRTLRTGSLLCLVLMAGSCRKQLDINHDPNFPSLELGTPALVLPVAVLATTGMVGGDLEIVGGMWSEFFTQANGAEQYTKIDTYDLPPSIGFVNDSWTSLYTTGLKNYQFVIDQAGASGDWNYYLMATVMKAYTLQVLVDLYDKVPYSEALKGSQKLDPKFDDGYFIYTSLLSSIDSALARDFSAITNTLPGKQDLVFSGNMDNWKAFANTLKLKMYLRMINAHADVATAGITALYNSGAVFLTTDAAVTRFTDAPSLDNPLYEQDKRSLNSPSNIRASTTFVSWLLSNSDPRIVYYFLAAHPASINQGDFAGSDPTYASAPVFRGTDHRAATDPVEFISLAESYFMQTEADIRYFGGSKAKGLYDQGVIAAFASINLDGSSFVAPGGAYEWGKEMEGGVALGQIEQVIRQKWASCAFGCHALEAYMEKNRTGFPASSSVYSTDAAYVPGRLVITRNSSLGPGLMPKRFVWPSTESTKNSNTPAQVPSTTPVWWAK